MQGGGNAHLQAKPVGLTGFTFATRRLSRAAFRNKRRAMPHAPFVKTEGWKAGAAILKS